MLNNAVSIFDACTGWLILGVVNLTIVHPIVLLAILVVLAVAACAVLADALGGGREMPSAETRPVRLSRRAGRP